MSKNELEDMDVIAMVNEHSRRQKITRPVGYIVTREEAHELAAARARAEHNEDGVGSIILFTMALMMIVIATVSILA